MRRPLGAVLVAALVALAGCSGGTGAARPSATTSPAGGLTPAQGAAVAAGAAAALTDPAGVEWLCRPGQSPDPCRSDLSAVVQPASGPARIERTALPADAAIDCFYVYPTVSRQDTALADLRIDPAETFVATAQASRFSQVCRVYAPVYRQFTGRAITDPALLTRANAAVAYDDVAAAWSDYLTHYNRGRGVVVIGHSQGAVMATALLRNTVDARPAVRRLLVSAILLGGNVTVPVGGRVGGSFAHIPACTSTSETGCVVAYSSFDQPPPAGSFFGRPGLGVSYHLGLVPGTTPSLPDSAMQVLCVNPAAPAGGAADLDPYLPAQGAGSAAAPWVTQPGLYRAQCMYADGASWLQVTAPVTPGDTRAVVGPMLGPLWGLHLVDVNIAFGNLVGLVRQQAAAYRSGRPR